MDEHRDEKGKFIKGYPGGPGRPKFSPLSILREELQKVSDGERETFILDFIQKYVAKAIKDVDGVAMRDIIDRFDGKPKQSITVNNEKDAEWFSLFKELTNEVKREAEEDNQVRSPEPAQDIDS